VVSVGGNTVVSATMYNGLGRVITETQRITFSAALGTVAPQAVDTVDGVAVATFTAGDVEGQAVITATSPNGWFLDTQAVRVGNYDLYLPLLLRQH